MELSIVLPCYNERENIEVIARSVVEWLKTSKIDGEVIVVDDGSRDASAEILERLQKEIPMLRVVTHEKNQGYGVAVRSGCDEARKEYIGFMDSDGQFKVEDFNRLLPHLKQYAFVTGRRRKRADNIVRNTYGKILGLFIWITLNLWVRDVNCGMKVFHRGIWPKIRPVHGVEKLFNTEAFLNLRREGIPWYQVDVPHYPRRAGTPTGGSFRVILRMFKELIALKRAYSAPLNPLPVA